MSFYALVALSCAMAYAVLVTCLIRCDAANSLLAEATRSDTKEKISLAACIGAIIAPFFGDIGRIVGGILLIAVSFAWIIPDRRIERALAAQNAGETP